MVRAYQFEEEAGWSHADGCSSVWTRGAGGWSAPWSMTEKCNYCGSCALYCPVQCMVNKGDHFEPNLSYCKGCGICATECPRKAITMEKEGNF